MIFCWLHEAENKTKIVKISMFSLGLLIFMLLRDFFKDIPNKL